MGNSTSNGESADMDKMPVEGGREEQNGQGPQSKQVSDWQRNWSFFKLSAYMVCCQCICCRRKKADLKDKVRIKEVKMLVIGLEGAGKSTLLTRLVESHRKVALAEKHSLDELAFKTPLNTDNIAPTNGFEIRQLIKGNINYNFWELGGNDSVRPYWNRYTQNIQGIIYVVDGSDREHLQQSITVLADFIMDYGHRYWPLLILITKSDLASENQVTVPEVAEMIGVFGDDRPDDVAIYGVSALPSGTVEDEVAYERQNELNEAFDWLASVLY